MGDVINLNRYRKKQARLARTRQSAANRAKRGLGKREKEAARREREQEARRLDARLLEDKSDREGGPKQG